MERIGTAEIVTIGLPFNDFIPLGEFPHVKKPIQVAIYDDGDKLYAKWLSVGMEVASFSIGEAVDELALAIRIKYKFLFYSYLANLVTREEEELLNKMSHNLEMATFEGIEKINENKLQEFAKEEKKYLDQLN